MDDYQKLTDVEILDTLENLKKELMAELCKLPEWNENETVHLNTSENVSADSREIKCDGKDLNTSVKDEEDYTRLKHLNFTMPSLITNCGKPSRTICSNEKYIGDLKLNHARISTCKGKNIETKSKCYHKDTHNRSPSLIERKHRNNANKKENIKVLPRVLKKVDAFNCAQCGTSFRTKVRLRHHIQKHEEYISLQQNQCKTTFVNEITMKINFSHDDIHPFECHQCKKKFDEIASLKEHLRIHDGIRSYECSQCKKRFTENGSLKKHLRIHSGIRPYECPRCKKRFTENGNLKKHLKIHSGIRPYECPRCKKRFTENGNLKKHLRLHDGIRPYECPQCKKRFTQLGNMKIHLRIHDGIRPYECPRCKRRFTQFESLKNHLRVHDGIRPYECSQCKKRFTENGSLKKHLRIHSGIRPYECPQCKKRFNDLGNFKSHMRIHNGSRPYECPECKKRFTQNGILKTHLRIHDGMRMSSVK